MSKIPYKIQIVQDELNKLSTLKNFDQARKVALSIVSLLDDQVDINNLNSFKLFNDDNGKIRANATWFYEDPIIADRKATYTVNGNNQLNIDFKLYGLVKLGKQRVSWITGVTSNFEDEQFNTKQMIGIDFVIPKTFDRVVVVLTNNYVIRTLELKEDITSTYQEILLKWIEIKDFSNKSAVHNVLWESFDLQPLNKKFYAGISERFITLRQHLMKENIFDEKHSSMFANRLIGRVIFTWFLDKKGIINSDQKYFDSKSFSNDNDYYKNKLEVLFFNVLNTPVSERDKKGEGVTTLFGKDEKSTLFSVDDITPFLNGGLFEARENDLYKDNKLSFPKNYFDDLFDFLSGYNFTTDESTSQFQQVAIDPEMLGRIFENLLAEITEETGEQARKAKGAFYTPREIVDYMCKESLKEYLKTKLPEDTYRDQRLYQLIDAPDKDFQDQDHNWRRDWKPYKEAIIFALDDLKVLDPACGSGAFPIGMLQLLVRVYERLEPRFDVYKAKLQIIEKNIFGVDIEPMAVEISRLRTWLSIIVDEESDSRKIKPLPNLEFKFVCANSLIDLDKSGQTVLYGDDPELENKLRGIRDAYFNTESVGKKKKLKSDYENIVNVGEGLFGTSEKSKQLKTYRPFDNETSATFFNSEFMFGVEKFNVIIGNPPYVNIVRLDETTRNTLKSTYSITKNKVDLYAYFIERSEMLICKNGVLALIIPQTWKATDSFSKLREFIFSKFILLKIVNLKMGTFDAVVKPLIFLAQKKDEIRFNNIQILNERFEIISSINSSDIINTETKSIDTESPDEYKKLFGKIQNNSTLLGKIIDFTRGIKTSNDGRFVTKENGGNEFKKVFRGRNVKAYSLNWNGEYVWYRPDLMKEKVGTLTHSSSLFEVPEKLVIQRVNSSMQLLVAYDNEKNYFLDTTNVSIYKTWDEVTPFKFLLGLLNSSLINFWYCNNYRMPTIGLYEIRSIPIKLGNKKQQEEIIILVDKILDSIKSDDKILVTALRKEIDELVMNLYDLNEDERDVIENSIK